MSAIGASVTMPPVANVWANKRMFPPLGFSLTLLAVDEDTAELSTEMP